MRNERGRKSKNTCRSSCSTRIRAAEGRISSALLPMLYAEKEPKSDAVGANSSLPGF